MAQEIEGVMPDEQLPAEEVIIEAEAEAEAEVPQEPQWTEEQETEARKYGWRDKSEYDLAP